MGYNAKITIGSGLVFLLVLVNGSVMYSALGALLETQRGVSHTWQVIGQGEKLIKMLLDMETGERGYLIVGKDNFLEPFNESTQEFWQELDITRSKVSNNPEQVERLNRVEHLSRYWINNQGRPLIDKRRRVNMAEQSKVHLQQLLNKGKGTRILAQLRRLFDQLTINVRDSRSLGAEAELLVVLLSRDMVDQEAGQRGFLVTGDDAFLGEFEQGRNAFRNHHAQLLDKVGHLPRIKAQVEEIAKLAGQWLTDVGRPAIAHRQAIGDQDVSMAEIIAAVESEKGKRVMDRLRAILTGFIEVEKQFIIQSQIASRHEAERAVQIALWGSMLITLGGGLIVWIILQSVNQPLAAVSRMMTALGRGETVQERVSYGADDHLGEVITSSNRVATNMARLTRRVQAISSGDYSQRVVPLSEQDVLGKAINEMRDSLSKNKRLTERQNWISLGLRDLTSTLSGHMETTVLADRVLAFLTRYVGAGQGVFYVVSSRGEDLSLLATCMVMNEDDIKERIAPGEGSIGQAYREKEVIHLTDITPESIPITPITTGTLSDVPLNIYAFPLLYEGQVYGVIELASFALFEEMHQNFIHDVGHLVAATLVAVMRQEQLNRLTRHDSQSTQGSLS